MFTPRDIVLGVLLPAAVTGCALVLGVLLGNAVRVRRALVPLGIGAAVAAGYGALLRVPAVPPLDSVGWLFYAAAAVGVVAAVDALFWPTRGSAVAVTGRSDSSVASGELVYTALEPPPHGATVTLRFAGWTARCLLVLGLSAVLVWLLTRPMLVFHWTGATGPMWIGGIALAIALIWLSLDGLAMRGGGSPSSLAIALALVSALSALVILLSGSQKLGQIAGMLTTALFATVLIGFALPRTPVTRGMVLPYALLHGALVATASEQLYASLTTSNAVLLLVSAPLAWAGELVPGRLRVSRAIVRVVAALTPAAVAAVRAGVEFARASEGYGDYGY